MSKQIRITVKILGCCLSLLFAPACFAKHVLPVFSGFWYTDESYTGEDNCSKNIYTYTNKTKGNAKETAGKLLSNPPERSDCKWTKIKLIYDDSDLVPIDFIGNSKDWGLISKNPMMEHPQAWGRKCLSKDDTWVDEKIISITPIYKCPAGSAYLLGNGDSGGCTSPPPNCQADIVGRDLDIPIINKAGHVALIEYSPIADLIPKTQIIEVLNKKPVIEENSYWRNNSNSQSLKSLSTGMHSRESLSNTPKFEKTHISKKVKLRKSLVKNYWILLRLTKQLIFSQKTNTLVVPKRLIFYGN